VTGLLIVVVSTVFGAIGWWLGAFVGVFTAFVVSTIASGVGIYVGRRLAQEYLP